MKKGRTPKAVTNMAQDLRMHASCELGNPDNYTDNIVVLVNKAKAYDIDIDINTLIEAINDNRYGDKTYATSFKGFSLRIEWSKSHVSACTSVHTIVYRDDRWHMRNNDVTNKSARVKLEPIKDEPMLELL